MDNITINENGINMVIAVTPDNEVKILHFSTLPFDPKTIREGEIDTFRLVEMNMTGINTPMDKMGNKHIGTAPGFRLKYVSHKDFRNKYGRCLTIETADEPTGVHVITNFQFFDGISVARIYNEVRNTGKEAQTLEYISSFGLNGIEKEGLLSRKNKLKLRIPHNCWQRELNWQEYTLEELGLAQSQSDEEQGSCKPISISNTGNWSTKEFLPMAYLENTETNTSLFWQIEQNGSWHWEIGDQKGHLYLQVSGPTEIESHWSKELLPGRCFVTVPVSVGVAAGGFDNAMGELTTYRRTIRRKNKDDENLPVIFNDYMNCLFGDPTTEKEIPLIDAAARAGCEYYVIDCGWYSPGDWWSNVGEWMPSKERFPEGLPKLLNYIRKKGMVPGLWLELEVMGIDCPKAKKVPDDWFFVRHGRKIYDRYRYQLDYRNPDVVAYSNSVVDRLVNDYGVGYIKMDYNIEPGIGTEINSDSVGDGLLGHERAYLAWLDSVFERYPNLVIENCSSGGMRMDYAMLSRYSIQSTSDTTDYKAYATISANAPSGLTPEQAAVWSYPMEGGDREEVIFNMVNALLLRIHQSGHLAKMSPEKLSLVTEGVKYYKSIRSDIRTGLPFWPLGLSQYSDAWVCMGLRNKKTAYIAVWRRGSREDTCTVPVNFLKGRDVKVKCGYPEAEDCRYVWNQYAGTLTVKFPKPFCARLFELHF